MPQGQPTAGLKRVKAHAKRRCPHCLSSKWRWRGAVPTTLEELGRHLLVRYRCEKCGGEFEVEEAKCSRVVASAGRCVHCRSSERERCSRDGADVELWRCRRCNAYMIIESGETSRPDLPAEDKAVSRPATPKSRTTAQRSAVIHDGPASRRQRGRLAGNEKRVC